MSSSMQKEALMHQNKECMGNKRPHWKVCNKGAWKVWQRLNAEL